MADDRFGPPVKKNETQDPMGKSVRGQRDAEGKAGQKTDQDIASAAAAAAKAYADISLIPLTKQKLQAEVGLIGYQAEKTRLELNEYRVASKVNGWVLDGLNTVEGLIPLKAEQISLEREAARLRAEGNEAMAAQFEAVAAFKRKQSAEASFQGFLPLTAGAELFSEMMSGVAGGLLGPEAKNLYGMRSDGTQPTAPTERRRFVPPSKD